MTTLRTQTEAKIRQLEVRSFRGLWALALFLLISSAVYYGLDRLVPLSPETRSFLGPAPPLGLISLALVIYSFSAIILVLGRMTMGQSPGSGFAHVGYLTGFYIFYHLAGTSVENLWAVLAAGVTILVLSGYHQYASCTEAISIEQETLARIELRERFSGGEGDGGTEK